ncbi:MAG: hypothetical protein EOP07_22040, partial [Proteobacteria bacterium]
DQIWDARTKTQIESMDSYLDASDIVVIGETHYIPAIAAVQAQIVNHVSREAATTLGWEFLNTIDLALVDTVEAQLKAGTMNEAQALKALFPTSTATPVEYSALIATAASANVDLIPTNLTRTQKSPITAGGMTAADPKLVPPGFELGSDAYYERFLEAMGVFDHSHAMDNYFASQSITDDVMAFELLKTTAAKKVLVTGSFHGDYKQGVVERLQARDAQSRVLYVKVVQMSDYTREEFQEQMVHPKYGPIADIIYLVDEDLSPAIGTKVKPQIAK